LHPFAATINHFLAEPVKSEKPWLVSIGCVGVYFMDFDSKLSVFDTRKIWPSAIDFLGAYARFLSVCSFSCIYYAEKGHSEQAAT
jgi:hypothetical protein